MKGGNSIRINHPVKGDTRSTDYPTKSKIKISKNYKLNNKKNRRVIDLSGFLVELAGFEPASRQAINKLSTCLVLFNFGRNGC